MSNSILWLLGGLLLSGCGYVTIRTLPTWRTSPLVVISGSWALMFLVSATQIIAFPPPPVEAFCYILAFPCMMMLGCFAFSVLVVKRSRIDQRRTTELYNAVPQLLRVILVLGLVGLVTKLYPALDRSLNVFELSDLRNVAFLQADRGRLGWIERIGELTFPFVWLSFMIGIVFSEFIGPYTRKLVCFFVFGLIVYGITSLGRTTAVRIVFLMFTCMMVRWDLGLRAIPWRWTVVSRVLVFLCVAFFLVYFLTVWGLRSGGLEYLRAGTTNFHSAATDSETMEFIYTIVPAKFVDTVNLLALYTATVPDNFCSFYELVDVSPLYGLWQLFGVSTILNRLGVPVEPALILNENVEMNYSLAGLQYGQWRTMAQEFILDFGKPGAIVAVLMTGVLAGWVYSKFLLRGAHWGVVLALVNYWIIFGVGTSPLHTQEVILLVYCLVFSFRIDHYYRLKAVRPISSHRASI